LTNEDQEPLKLEELKSVFDMFHTEIYNGERRVKNYSFADVEI